MTIQYQGEDTWAFWIRYSYPYCIEEFCQDDYGACIKKTELLHFVMKEEEPCLTPFSICSGLSNFGFIDVSRFNQDVPTLLTVDHEDDKSSGLIMFKTSRETACEPTVFDIAHVVYVNKFLVNSSSENSRRLVYSMNLHFRYVLPWMSLPQELHGEFDMSLVLSECEG